MLYTWPLCICALCDSEISITQAQPAIHERAGEATYQLYPTHYWEPTVCICSNLSAASRRTGETSAASIHIRHASAQEQLSAGILPSSSEPDSFPS